jgi:hypothetical protein
MTERRWGPVRLAYQPPANSTFLSEQTSHQQPASSTFISEQISTSHQPPAKRTGQKLKVQVLFNSREQIESEDIVIAQKSELHQ